MKVLHIITGLQNGGAEAVLNSLCRFDADNSHSVVSLMDFGKYGDGLKQAGVNVYCLNQRSGRFSIAAMIRLVQIIRNEAPDAVQTWMLHADLVGGLAARLAGVRAISWGVHHTTYDKHSTPLSTRFVFTACRWLSWLVPRKIICCSQATQAHLERSGYDPKKLVFVPNGYDLTRFVPDEKSRVSIRLRHEISNDTLLLGMVGRYSPQKDFNNLIHALSCLINSGIKFKALCIGPGVDSNNIEFVEIINRLGLENKILLLGPVQNVPDYMNSIDLHILSSAFGEAFPNVLNEAMACGTPCVTTDVGDAAYIVGDTGWVCPPKNPEKLAEAILIAIDSMQNPAEYEKRCRAARERVVNHFSIERMVHGYNEVWRANVIDQ